MPGSDIRQQPDRIATARQAHVDPSTSGVTAGSRWNRQTSAWLPVPVDPIVNEHPRELCVDEESSSGGNRCSQASDPEWPPRK